MANILKQIEVDNTIIHKVIEENPVFLFGEFIDNSLSSYNHLKKSNADNKVNDVNIVLDRESGYIMIQDFATGFDINSKISKKGKDSFNEIKNKKLNKYNDGMKTAIDFFTRYCIIFSKTANESAKVCLYLTGGVTDNIEIDRMPEPFNNNNQTGTSFFLFKDIDSINRFIDENKEILQGKISPLSRDEDKDSWLSTNINYIFNAKATDDHKYLYSMLYCRYSPSVDILDDFKINFYDNLNQLNEGDKQFEIAKDFWYKDATFDFYEFFASEKMKSFMERYNDSPPEQKNNFKDEFSLLIYRIFLDDYIYNTNKSNKNKENTKIYEEIEEAIELGALKINFSNIDSDDYENYYSKSHEKYLPDNELPKYLRKIYNCFVQLIFNGINKNREKSKIFLFLNFNNLSVMDRKINFSSPVDNNSLFDLKFNLFFYNKEYYERSKREKINYIHNNKSGDISHKLVSGFDVIQDERSIYHGPNFDENNTFVIRKKPNKLLKNELHKSFPGFTHILKGDKYEYISFITGTRSTFYENTFGSIVVPNDDDFFEPGPNKTSITGDGFDGLGEFYSKYVVKLGLNAITNFLQGVVQTEFTKTTTSRLLTMFDKINENGKKDISEPIGDSSKHSIISEPIEKPIITVEGIKNDDQKDKFDKIALSIVDDYKKNLNKINIKNCEFKIITKQVDKDKVEIDLKIESPNTPEEINQIYLTINKSYYERENEVNINSKVELSLSSINSSLIEVYEQALVEISNFVFITEAFISKTEFEDFDFISESFVKFLKNMRVD